MIQTLTDAIDAMDSTDRGFHFASDSTAVTQMYFSELRRNVRSLARRLDALGQRRGDSVIIAFSDQSLFIQAFLAIIRAGLVVVPVHPPTLTEDSASYRGVIERIRRISGARYVLTDDVLHTRLRSMKDMTGLISWSECMNLEPCGSLPTSTATDPALIQFTSGSTSQPKGVEISHGNLVSNARAIQQALDIDPARDRGVSWLPLHHDMGLIGFLVTPVLIQASNWFLSPMDFARHPRRWLELMHQTRATISYAPNFGYHLATRSIRDSDSNRWDLSAWRVAGCGGEPIVDSVLDRFARRLQPAGFCRKALVPSYGLAEATVAVTIARPKQGLTTRRSDHAADRRCTLISSGDPVTDTEVRIVSPSGDDLGEGMEGEIHIRGPGVSRRHWHEDGWRLSTDADGWLKTGDRGVLIDKELHVCGRIKESILINGCNHYPHDIEACVRNLEGMRRGQAVAFGRPAAGSEQVVLIVESTRCADTGNLPRRVRQAVRHQLGLNVADVVIVERGVITRTTSGKVRRQTLRQRYLAGELSARDAADDRVSADSVNGVSTDTVNPATR